MNIKQRVSCALLLTTLNSFAAHFYNATTKTIQISGGRGSLWQPLASNTNTTEYYKPRMRWAFPDKTSGYYFAIKFSRDDAKLLEVKVRFKELKEFQEPTFVITEDPSTPSGLDAELVEGKEQEKKKRGPGAPGGSAFPEEEKKRAAADEA